MSNVSRHGTQWVLNYFAVTVGVLAVGAIDHVTGSDVHVISLYFVPLALAGWRLGRTGAAIASLLSTMVWLAALFTNGARYARPYIWVVNFLTQGIAFLTVSILVAVLSEALQREQVRSRTDALTGLWNRQAFLEQASLALSLCKRHARPAAMAYIDLDNFKNVNDSLGHLQGDALLRECGQKIASSLRSSDIGARLGGDEFVVFLPGTNAENATALLDRLRRTLELSDTFRDLEVTVSIGAVVDELAGSSIDNLLGRADAQMYEVKRDRKNRGRT